METITEQKDEALKAENEAWYKLWDYVRNSAYGGVPEIPFDDFVEEGKKLFEVRERK